MSKVLIIDDDKDISKLITLILKKENIETEIINNPLEVIQKINQEEFNYDLILLDIMMPELSGTELCTRIRNKFNIPIIFVSAKSEMKDKIEGYELGGDDYITKPFDNTELLLKVKSHLRITERANHSPQYLIKIGDITLNKENYEVKKNNLNIDLSTREFELLKYLMEHVGTTLSKEQIYEEVWGSKYGDIGTVAVHIKSIRNKLKDDDKYIKTIWGYGYKFVWPEDNNEK